MSGSGNCYDNAVVESFFATLKTEEVEGADYQTRQQAKTSVFSYLEGFYNRKRRHSYLRAYAYGLQRSFYGPMTFRSKVTYLKFSLYKRPRRR